MRFLLGPLLMLGLIAACSPAGSKASVSASRQAYDPASGRHPVSGLAVIPLTIERASKRHTFKVEVAASPAEQQQGLMFRTTMGPDEGMLFPSTMPETRAFWMKNTVMPLDIIYIGQDGRILNIADAKPYDETPLYSKGKAIAVLELNAGRSRVLGIAPGDLVKW